MTDFYDTLLAGAIDGGGGGGEAVLINKDITANGTYNASSDSADGYKKVVVNVPNPSTGTIQITQNGTVNVTNYASADVNVSGQSTYNFTGASGKAWGGMAKALVDGTYVSGTVTYTTAFANTYQEILDTGLQTINGFCCWLQNMITTGGAGTSSYIIFTVEQDNTLNYLAFPYPGNTTNKQLGGLISFGYVQETQIDQAGMTGAVRLNGGKIEYKGRYNQNSSYQILPINKTIEWIAW